MKKALWAMEGVLAGAAAVLPFACANNPYIPSNPTATATVTAAPTSTPTLVPPPTGTPTPVVFWSEGYLKRYQYPGQPASQAGYLALQVNGTPASTATVVLGGSNIPTPVAFTYMGDGTDTVNPGTWSLYRGDSGWTYQAGATYSLTSVVLGVTSSVTMVAPGSVTTLLDGAGAVTEAQWAVEGNNDTVEVVQSGTTVTSEPQNDLDSPYPIPVATAYPASGGVTYDVNVLPTNYTGSIAKAWGGSQFFIQDFHNDHFVK